MVNPIIFSIEHSDEVNLEEFKAIDRNVSHINGPFWNHAKNKNDHLYEIEQKLRYLEDSSRRKNFKIEGIEEEEADNEIWEENTRKM